MRVGLLCGAFSPGREPGGAKDAVAVEGFVNDAIYRDVSSVIEQIVERLPLT